MPPLPPPPPIDCAIMAVDDAPSVMTEPLLVTLTTPPAPPLPPWPPTLLTVPLPEFELEPEIEKPPLPPPPPIDWARMPMELAPKLWIEPAASLFTVTWLPAPPPPPPPPVPPTLLLV